MEQYLQKKSLDMEIMINDLDLDIDINLSQVSISSELQNEKEALAFLENDSFDSTNEITFIISSLEDSTADSIEIHISTYEAQADNVNNADECEEILSIIKGKATSIAAFPIIHRPIPSTKPNLFPIPIYRPVPKKKTC